MYVCVHESSLLYTSINKEGLKRKGGGKELGEKEGKEFRPLKGQKSLYSTREEIVTLPSFPELTFPKKC